MVPDPDCLSSAEKRVRACYRSAARHHHDESHLDDCLAQLERVAGIEPGERRLLRWAILWHDCIYDPGAGDNEKRSAQLARRELTACGVDAAGADEVARLISLTKGHKVEPDDRLGALLVSIDLSILGRDAATYRRYAEAIRREYAHVPDAAFRAGRAALLQRMLCADPLFPDQRFANRFERRARSNIESELSRLLSS